MGLLAPYVPVQDVNGLQIKGVTSFHTSYTGSLYTEDSPDTPMSQMKVFLVEECFLLHYNTRIEQFVSEFKQQYQVRRKIILVLHILSTFTLQDGIFQ